MFVVCTPFVGVKAGEDDAGMLGFVDVVELGGAGVCCGVLDFVVGGVLGVGGVVVDVDEVEDVWTGVLAGPDDKGSSVAGEFHGLDERVVVLAPGSVVVLRGGAGPIFASVCVNGAISLDFERLGKMA